MFLQHVIVVAFFGRIVIPIAERKVFRNLNLLRDRIIFHIVLALIGQAEKHVAPHLGMQTVLFADG